MRIGVVAKPGDKSIAKILFEILKTANENGIEVLFDSIAASYIGSTNIFDLTRETPDVVIVVGGDGTFLRTVQLLGDRQPAIMTIRLGRRGFLLDVNPYEVSARIRDLLDGKYMIVRYMRLQVRIEGKNVKLPYALNEAAFLQPDFKVVRLRVFKDNEPLFSVDGDGIIVATPIGSTAYSLSAGGPIVDPEVQSIIITPLNPLQLYLRSIVLSPSSIIQVAIRSDSPHSKLLIDGQYSVDVKPGEIVTISRAQTPVRVIRFQRLPIYERVFERR